VTEALSFEHLRDFLQNRRRMSHIYQPVRRAKTEPIIDRPRNRSSMKIG
jgi:hypothetical protein